MKKENLLKAVPFAMIIVWMLSSYLKYEGYTDWSYFCMGLFVGLFILVLFNKPTTQLDAKIQRKKNITLVVMLIISAVIFIASLISLR